MQVVFLYKPAGMLFATDFFWAYPSSGTQTATQFWKFGMDRIYGPFYRSFMIKDRGQLARLYAQHTQHSPAALDQSLGFCDQVLLQRPQAYPCKCMPLASLTIPLVYFQHNSVSLERAVNTGTHWHAQLHYGHELV